MLNGKAYFMDSLVASSINSRHGRPLSFVTSHNLSVSIRNSRGKEVSNFILSKCRVEVIFAPLSFVRSTVHVLTGFVENNTVKFNAPSFNITGSRGEVLFSADRNEIVFGTGEVRFTGNSSYSLLPWDWAYELNLILSLSCRSSRRCVRKQHTDACDQGPL